MDEAKNIETCETLIVSDVHLGSPISMAKELRQLLSRVKFNRLILLGDIFSDLNFKRLTKEHWELISFIRKLSNPKRGVEVVWVEGNHDEGVTQVMEHLIGVKVYQRYEWKWKNKICVAMHGHQFDGVLAIANPKLSGFFIGAYLLIQQSSLFRRWLPTLLDRFHTHYQGLTLRVAAGALHVAKQDRAQLIFCGHTHEPYHQVQDNVEYWNSGCWTGTKGTYITLGDTVAIKECMSKTAIEVL